jgi:hypothetical protein
MRTKPTILPIWDARMLELMDYLISTKEVKDKNDFLLQVGFNINNLSQIRTGKQSFQQKHLQKAGKLWSVNMNWFYGFEIKMKRVTEMKGSITLLQEAVKAIELEYGNKKWK